jgi:hypothetical protein
LIARLGLQDPGTITNAQAHAELRAYLILLLSGWLSRISATDRAKTPVPGWWLSSITPLDNALEAIEGTSALADKCGNHLDTTLHCIIKITIRGRGVLAAV